MGVKFVKKEERIGIRLTAKERFELDLLAVKLGKPVSAVVKDAVDAVLKDKTNGLYTKSDDNTQSYIADICWDPLEPDRFVKLATVAPELLTDKQQVIWKVISEDEKYWSKTSPRVSLIRDDWDLITSEADQWMNKHGKPAS